MSPRGSASSREPGLIVERYRDDRAAGAGVGTTVAEAAGTEAAGRSDPSAPAEETGKFVVLLQDKTVHLVLSPVTLTPYHADIVYRYLQIEGRGKVETSGNGHCRIVSRGWKIHGGGHFTLQHWLHHMILHGKSTAFGKYDQALLDLHADALPDRLGLSSYTLELK